ncbi:GDP-mannose 4,6-dehydratase [bacterium]|nr:GDP-mannose 4,6-dehydratase [bacterium]
MPPVVLITGTAGFAGSHLAELCLAQGCEVHGTYRSSGRLDNIADFAERLHLHECDLREAEAVRTLTEAVRPQLVFHLAAQASVVCSWQDPAGTISGNTACETNLLDALRDRPVRIHVACSSEEYSGADGLGLLTETAPLHPRTPYGISKLAQDLLAEQYAKAYGMYIVRTRAFNHTGPRLGAPYAMSAFARQIALIECGVQEPVLRVGNLSARRNYTDVRDIVRGYWLALQGGCPPGSVYNLCGSACRSIGELLNILLSFSRVSIEVQIDPERLRPSDVPCFDGDGRQFSQATGWKPEITLEQSLADLLGYWRIRVKHEQGNGCC